MHLGRRASILAAAGLIVLALGGIAEAKQSSVITRSASSTGSGNGTVVTATASCPKKTLALSGGFLETPRVPTGAVGLVFESQKVGQKAWRVSSQISSGPSIPELSQTINLQTFVYCSGSAPKTKTRAATATLGVGYNIFPPLSSGCTGKLMALAGGFLMPRMATSPFGNNNHPTASLRGNKRSWQTTSSGGYVNSSFTNYAYCAKQKKAPRAVSATTPTTPGVFMPITAAASCPGNLTPTSGGFVANGLSGGGPVGGMSIHESQLVGPRAWRISGVYDDTRATSSLSASVYCR